MKAPVTTHVLDLQTGRPAAGLAVELRLPGAGAAAPAKVSAVTDSDGRIDQWSERFELVDGSHRLRFATGPWFDQQGRDVFYPTVSVTFRVAAQRAHYHVPLLLSPYGYSTYRGS